MTEPLDLDHLEKKNRAALRTRKGKAKRYHMTPFYSGDMSGPFWDEVNSYDDRTLYILGCALQEVEGRMLQAMERLESLAATRRKR